MLKKGGASNISDLQETVDELRQKMDIMVQMLDKTAGGRGRCVCPRSSALKSLYGMRQANGFLILSNRCYRLPHLQRDSNLQASQHSV